MMKRLLPLFLLCSFLASNVRGQDPGFSQFYSAPMYLNPAFTGTTNGHRFISNYRNQWPSIPGAFVTCAFSYDLSLKELNSGFGLMAYTDKAGSMGLRSTSASFLHSYAIKLSKKLAFKTGLNFSYSRRSLDYNRFIFGDQLEFTSSGNGQTFEPLDPNSFNDFFDFSSGGLLYSKKYWFGFAVSHINRPDKSLTENKDILPIKWLIHGGARLSTYNGLLKKKRILEVAPSFLYQRQYKFDQLDLGMHFYYEPFMTGMWYKGIPILQKNADLVNHDAITILFGAKIKSFTIGYSYDLTISKLGPGSGGAHELSLSYEIPFRQKQNKPSRKEALFSCPAFMKGL